MPTEFTLQHYNNLLLSKYKYVEIIPTGKSIETSPEYFRKEVILRAYETERMDSHNRILEINDPEIADIAQGSDTDIFYIELT